MSIERADFEVIVNKINEIKSKNSFVLSNIFCDFNTLFEILKKKECFSLQSKNSIVIIIPYHDIYYDMLYSSMDVESLKSIISDFKNSYSNKLWVRVSVIGKEPEAGYVASLFEDAGFYLGKKLARTAISKKTDRVVQEAIHCISSRKESDSSHIKSSKKTVNEIFIPQNVSFAVPGDEYEILSLLLEEFDPCDDNIPELEVILENIDKNNVIVIRDNGVIACLHYFEIKNGKYFGLYDITRKEYRDKFLFFEIQKFLQKYFIENNIIINRYYAWRDTANKRLMKFATLNNQLPDGLYIYNMKWIS